MDNEQPILLAEAVDTLDSRCQNCNVRPRREEQIYCSTCTNRFQRKQNLTPEIIDALVIGIVEPLYANATMDDINSEIRDKLRDRKSEQDVFLYGLPGRGKTHLFAALIRAYIGQGYKCMKISFDEFCCKVRSTMNPASTITEWELTEKLKAVDMLFIDDLGIGSNIATNFVYQTFFLILNKRQERLLPTFISSNKSIEELRPILFDDRVVSRLLDALIIEMTGVDRRKKDINVDNKILTEQRVGGAKFLGIKTTNTACESAHIFSRVFAGGVSSKCLILNQKQGLRQKL